MSAQRHRIRRQLLEVTLPSGDRSAAWQLQAELARIQKHALEELLDRCLSEASDPDRLQRIDRLEIDLGSVRFANLEYDLVKKLGPTLKEALAEKLREADERLAGRSLDPESAARLELVALFLQSGSLPWWADTSQPRRVDEAVGFLLERAPGPLLAFVQSLLREEQGRKPQSQPGQLLRLVLACTDERLAALFAALLASAQPALAARSSEQTETLRQLLHLPQALPGTALTRFRAAVWLSALRTAGAQEHFASPLDFWRQLLGRTALAALAAAASFPTLLTGLRSHLAPLPPAPLHAIVTSLTAELRGEPPPLASPALPDPSHLAALRTLLQEALDAASSPDELPPLLAQLEQLTPPEPLTALVLLISQLRTALPQLTPAQRSALRPPLRALLEQLRSGSLDTTAAATLSATLAAAAGTTPADMQVSPPQPEPTTATTGSDELLRLLEQLEQRPSTLPALFAELFRQLRAVGSRVPMPKIDALLEPLRALEAQVGDLGAPESLPLVRQLLAGAVAEGWLDAASLRRLLALFHQAQSQAQSQSVLDARLRPQALAEAPQAAVTRRPAPSEPPQIDVAFGDADEVYVENAGLVLLWPFFVHLFERLDLMVEKQFKDEAAQHRAIGLLQHLVTGETEPAEYQVTLPKILCGLDPTALWDFGPPVTAAEQEECENLLTAAILNAPILGPISETSIEALRQELLIRKGALGSRDGAWLLRVERTEYDLVLERLPWTVSWIKLPWIAAPLAVEW